MSESIQDMIKRLKEKKVIQEPTVNEPEKLQNEQINQQKEQQMEKQEIPQKIIEIPQNLFEGLIFSFPIQNVNLTKNRMKFLKEVIRKYGGQTPNFDDPQCQETYVDFVIVDQWIQRSQVHSKINQEYDYQEILRSNYIQDCLKEGELLPIEFYILIDIKPIKKTAKKNKSLQKTQQPVDEHKNVMEINSQDFQKKDPRGFAINKKIALQLEKIHHLYEKIDKKKANTYGFLANRIKNYPSEIKNDADVDALLKKRIVGFKTAAKIKEFIRTGAMSKLNELSQNQENRVCGMLQKVWGIGPSRAQDLYAKGIKSIVQLREAVEKNESLLTKNQKIGLMYYQDLNKRIPREKITRMFEFVKNTLHEMTGCIDMYQIEVCGSYRRQIPTCGDIDIIITRVDGYFEKGLVEALANELKNRNFITDHLTQPRHIDPNSCISYMGVCKFQDQTHHRIDIKYYPQDQYAFAVLYFTGSYMFNISMRLYALARGYCLSDHGMQQATKIGTKTVPYGEKIICLKEEDIFKFLNLEFKCPSERSV